MEEKVNELLSKFGLGKTEISIYIDLLKNPNSSASDISNRTHFHRPNVYDSLNRLKSQGFVIESINDKKTVYKSQDFDKLKEFPNQISRTIEELMPFVENLQNTTRDKEVVNVSYGKMALRNAMFDTLESESPCYSLGLPIETYELIGAALDEYHAERIKRKIPLKIIYSEYKEWMKEINDLPFAELRQNLMKEDNKTSMVIVGDKIIFIVYKDPILVLEIKSKEISNLCNQHFMHYWKISKPIKK